MLTVLEGNSFLVADDHGDVLRHTEGLYAHDTRYLSRWQLRINGERPQLLSSRTVDYYSAAVFLQNPPSHAVPAGAVSLIRDIFVGEAGMQDCLRVENHLIEPVELQIGLEFDFDFLDVFEVKAREYREEDLVFTDRTEPRLGVRVRRDRRENSWSFRLNDGGFEAQALLWSSQQGEAHERGSTHAVSLPRGGSWELRTNVVLLRGQQRRKPRYTNYYFGQERDRVEESLRSWQLSAPTLETDWEDMQHAFGRSLADLAALRMRLPTRDGPHLDLPAAGLPWFMTVFGRDTLLTSYQTLLLGPNLAIGTLRALASLQATDRDDRRDAEPGKIVHELRVGRVAAEGDYFPYYGTVDATTLFLILLSEVHRWTDDREIALEFRDPAMAALRWIREEADLLDAGYIAYHRRSPHGLESQSWKDSWDSMRYRDGSIARTPIATCETQGYAYDARRRMAELARTAWDDTVLADQLDGEADQLKQRFNHDFWIEDGSGGYFALGLDHQRRPIDALSSNVGHLLWSGIVDDERVAAVAERLLSRELFSGWGVRTMSDRDHGFNPIGYHTGTVWPHDNSLIVAGLCRNGYRQYANRIAAAMIEAARHFQYRLPEVFAGYPRERTPFPVAYPTACSPQAWAAGAPVLCLTQLLGLRPDRSTHGLVADAVLPDVCSQLELRGVSMFGRRFDVSVRGGRTEVRESP